jgi:hypothetical protein
MNVMNLFVLVVSVKKRKCHNIPVVTDHAILQNHQSTVLKEHVAHMNQEQKYVGTTVLRTVCPSKHLI